MKEYDVIVIGGGGGTKLVTPVAALGLKVAIFEKEAMGGTCLNRGCIPSKMMIHPADRICHMQESYKFEIGLKASFDVDFKKLVERISNSVDKDAASIPPAYEKNPNIDFYPLEAKFISNKVISAGGKEFTADKIFIATGSRPFIPDIPGLEGTPYMTSREALRNTELPKRMVVIGGGFIALELGHAYSTFGSSVDFLLRSKPLSTLDEDLIEEFSSEFSKRNNLHLNTEIIGVSFDNNEFTVKFKESGAEKELIADQLLVATGVKPNSDNLGLENTSIELKQSGYIKTNNALKTTVPGVWAIGDVVGNYMFRHSVNFEGEYLFRTIFKEPSSVELNYGPVPSAVFTHPEIATVGISEKELIKNGKIEGTDYVTGKNPYRKSAMGSARLSESGFVKVIVEKNTKKLLGAQIIGDEASNMIHLFIAFIKMNGTLDDMLDMIFVHPALPEIARNAGRIARLKL